MSQERGRSGNGRFALGTVAGVATGVVLVIGALSLVPAKSAAQRPGGSPSASPSTAVVAVSSMPTASTSVGGLATPASGSWIALIRWMPKTSFTLEQASEYATTRSTPQLTAVVVDTDLVQLKGGKSGQYAIVVVGLASMAEATSTCEALKLTPGPMCGRYQIG